MPANPGQFAVALLLLCSVAPDLGLEGILAELHARPDVVRAYFQGRTGEFNPEPTLP